MVALGVRRFMNLLVENGPRGTYSLRRFDLSRDQFFYSTPQEVASDGKVVPIEEDVSALPYLLRKKKLKKKPKQLAASEIGIVRLPAPLFNLRPAPSPTVKHFALHGLDAYPLAGSNKVLFVDSETRVFSYDADSHCFVTMPSLQAPKSIPLAVSIPGPAGGSSLYIIEKMLFLHKSSQFEALISQEHDGKPSSYPWRTWKCHHTLPLPPLEREPDDNGPVLIYSSAVVGNLICISFACRGRGTYCFDTASHTWSRAGDWMLPFFGTTGEYVPELNLWFGFAGHNDFPCAADLSPVLRGQPPEPAVVWADHPPEEWHHTRFIHPKMVSLGSGRFCIIRFLETRKPSQDFDEERVDKAYAVFTGLEVLPGKGKHKLRVIRHKSKRCRNLDTNSIQCLF